MVGEQSRAMDTGKDTPSAEEFPFVEPETGKKRRTIRGGGKFKVAAKHVLNMCLMQLMDLLFLRAHRSTEFN